MRPHKVKEVIKSNEMEMRYVNLVKEAVEMNTHTCFHVDQRELSCHSCEGRISATL